MSVISLKLKNISARIPPPFFSPFFSKEDIKQLLLKKFFHYNVSHDAILATRSYKIDSFSIVNFPLIHDSSFLSIPDTGTNSRLPRFSKLENPPSSPIRSQNPSRNWSN